MSLLSKYNADFLKTHFIEFLIVLIVILFFLVSKLLINKLTKKFNINKSLSKNLNFLFIIIILEILKSQINFSPILNKISSFVELALIITIFYNLIVKIYIEDYLIKYKQKQIKHIIIDIIKLIFLVIFILSILRIVFNIDIITLLTPSAILTAIIGLSMKDTIGNLISGLIIQIEKPFDVGDWIKVDNESGEVVEINWRYTKLKTLDNIYLIIPNNTISSGNLLNYNKPEKSMRILLNIGVSYDTPPAKLKQVVMKVLKNCIYVDKSKEINIYLKNYNDFSIDYDIAFWIKEYRYLRDARDEIYSSLWYEFKMANIEIPFPIRTIIQKPLEDKKDNTDADITNTVSLISKIPLFQNLPESLLFNIVKFSHIVSFPAGTTIIKENETGESMFVVIDGELEIIKNGKKIAEITKGDMFGEMSLLTGEKRMATVITKTDSTLLEISRPVFKVFLHNTSLYNNIVKILEERLNELKTIVPNNKENIKSTQNLLTKFKNIFNI
ncbi:mechanosensitive ion channel family protein [Deferribacter thermophilus]|uniref:cyclic nucleotide-binding domain-containing protein n=1 Tax=Deferribacter thermophilus TaxID=53573 RepID=UPI003C171A2D